MCLVSVRRDTCKRGAKHTVSNPLPPSSHAYAWEQLSKECTASTRQTSSRNRLWQFCSTKYPSASCAQQVFHYLSSCNCCSMTSSWLAISLQVLYVILAAARSCAAFKRSLPTASSRNACSLNVARSLPQCSLHPCAVQSISQQIWKRHVPKTLREQCSQAH